MWRAIALAFCLIVLIPGCREKKIEPQPAPVVESERVSIDDVRAMIDEQIKEGFRPRDEIIEFVVESIEIDEGELGKINVPALVDRAFAARKVEEASWRGPTDCDRLTTAFRQLEREGIIARENFSDCQTCGHSEIGAEMEAVEKAGHRVDGYVFYHEQDTEGAASGGPILLAYGSVKAGKASAIACGDRIVAALKKQGLKASWNRTVEQRIAVDLEWKKRRFAESSSSGSERAEAAPTPRP